ncbi:MAG: hypothetical protein K6V36_16290, partial [Anaerolineae bacterium]|nr:hypothetical protein [Anaerolineae bacterium]
VRTGYTHIDLRHYMGARAQAQQIYAQLRAGYRIIRVEQETSFGFGFAAVYETGEAYDPAQIDAVALGIFEDYSKRFEVWQGRFLGGVQERMKASSFANEDLPSDYLGFYSVATNSDLNHILRHLGGYSIESRRLPKPHTALGPLQVGDMRGKNYEFSPRVRTEGGWENVPWPEALRLPPGMPPDRGVWWCRGSWDIWPWR